VQINLRCKDIGMTQIAKNRNKQRSISSADMTQTVNSEKWHV